jgi:hypothetical protein
MLILLICGLPGQAQLIEPGTAVATCFSEFTNRYDQTSPIDRSGFVLLQVDMRYPNTQGAVFGTNWATTLFHNDDNEPWDAEHLGQVFGIALDDSYPPNIYVTATSSYGRFLTGGAEDPGLWGPGGPGAIYKIDGTSGSISVFRKLPNSGPALGNICYSPQHKSFYVSNFEDGKIYRLDLNGNMMGTYDHGLTTGSVADDGLTMNPAYHSDNTSLNSGFSQLGRRVWAVQVYDGHLYYSTWGRDRGRQTGSPNEVWSVALANNGAFLPADVALEVTPPVIEGNYSCPVSDIAFSSTGKMLLGERTMREDVGEFKVSNQSGHRGRILEFTGRRSNWSGPAILDIGGPSVNLIHANCEGGVSYGIDLFNGSIDLPPICDGSILATGEQLTGNSVRVYGIQISPPGGPTDETPWSNSYAIDLDGFVSSQDVFIKSRIGDVEAFQNFCFPENLKCMDIVEQVVTCVGRDGDTYQYELEYSFYNNSPFNSPANQMEIAPVGFSAPGFPKMISFATVGPMSTSGVIKVPFSVVNGQPGDTYCFNLTPSSTDGQGKLNWCCPAQTLCVTLPECVLPCLQAKLTRDCETNLYEITIDNNGTFPAEKVQLFSQTPGLTVSQNVFSVNIPPGGSTTISTHINGPGFNFIRGTIQVSIHGPIDPKTGVAECCFFDLPVDLIKLACPWNPVIGVFHDDNGNGLYDGGETGLPGWTVYVEGPQGMVIPTVTDESGFAVYETFEPGLHAFSLRMQEGFRLTSDRCTYELDFGESRELEVLYLGVTDSNP